MAPSAKNMPVPKPSPNRSYRSAEAAAPRARLLRRMSRAASRDDYKEESKKFEESAVDASELESSMVAQTHAANVSGLSRYDLGEALTIPDGTSTMVAIINQQVEGEETFLFKPGGAGQGYEANPYRVIRSRTRRRSRSSRARSRSIRAAASWARASASR